MTPPVGDAGATELDLDAGVDELYATAPSGFVAARDDLARRLRVAGRREDAAAVKRLRRPTVAAWALNQLRRRRGDDVRRLVQHGHELRGLQHELLAGGGHDRLRDATRIRRAALDALADVALETLREHGTVGAEAHRDEVLATLEAASLEPEAGAALMAGRLTTGLAPSPGFGLLDGSSPDASAPAPPSEPDVRHDERDDDDGARAARLAEAREVAADARVLAEQRRAEAVIEAEAVAAARRGAAAAADEVARLTRSLDRARRSATEAASEAQRAVDRLARAERAAAAADAQAAAALARLDAG